MTCIFSLFQDIRKFFGSPPAKKAGGLEKAKETNNNNNNIPAKKVAKHKDEKQKRDKSVEHKERVNEDRKKDKKKSRHGSEEFTKIADKEEKMTSSRKRKHSSEKESSAKKKPLEVVYFVHDLLFISPCDPQKTSGFWKQVENNVIHVTQRMLSHPLQCNDVGVSHECSSCEFRYSSCWLLQWP